MGVRWRQRWGDQPVWARCALVVWAIGFAVGTRAHVVDLVRGGLGVYASFGPVVLQVFFISLVVLDPMVVVLVVLARPSGVWLGLVVGLDAVQRVRVGFGGPAVASPVCLTVSRGSRLTRLAEVRAGCG